MKNETARREIESLDYYLQNHTDDYSEESHTAMMMAKDALSNAVLDKIRNEIQKVLDAERDFTSENAKAQAIALSWCLDIIDKYMK